jgi:anti-sigma factor RsiW
MAMCEKDRLVEYLYDEMPPTARQTFEAHLSECADCRAEVASLGGVRTALTRWTPPEPDFAFEVVRTPAARSAQRWFRVSPGWGLAAAAVLVLAAASAVANIEVTYGASGLTVRTGWGRVPAQPPAAERASVATAPAVPAAWHAEVDALGTRVHDLESALASRGTFAAAHAAAPRQNDAELLRQVRQLIADSEERQNGVLTQVVRDIEGTRRADLARIEQAYAHVRGLSDTTSLRQAAIEDRLFRVVGQQK